ncbi:MCP methyltransferase, CheR-type [Sulfurimonas denitrificans DSM 1251]|jgi:chemotaxis protein methyltransferase CheR|uniref:protein-glutamate O-methyltransferase n=1 Tax=Sulfurimonas denitrificans (strain ATCC 33889 / DSM 1251) TaxID=326298 RepID=Q30RX8_SULDN|nr:protein-glutamate O-methyltransferase CheR [Sulfurimonas denitrificans]ABB44253.1 MCP methyltransferase, CheR-type [Sulfurimonas denitrificans DSM 1251]MDD3443087.1 protein-glutamate O-methyltransferase CheR [Sulfurimonas denitrificans]
MNVAAYEITKSEFKELSEFVYKEVGIHLAEHKIMLVRSRLSKRLRELNLRSFKEYLAYLNEDGSGEETIMLINEISTNVTSFFREQSQWDFLEQEVKVFEAAKKRTLRIYSAACSSGQEPYTIAMFLLSTLKNPQDWDIKILATDISENILLKAMEGCYSAQDIGALPKSMLLKFFDKKNIMTKQGNELFYEIKPFVKSMITFRSFNLVYGNYSKIPQSFDMIFCRNVMIYFDKETKEGVVKNLSSKILKGGYFFIGHSESLVTMKDGVLKLEKPSIYKKQ